MAVDIGQEATDRSQNFIQGYTLVNTELVASIAGKVTSIDIWAYTNITGLKVGVFYTTNGDTLKCRSAQSIAGTITAGSKVNKVTDLTVEIGDYLGCYFSGGAIERTRYPPPYGWQDAGDNCVVDSEEAYAKANQQFSIGGYISVAAAGRSFGFIIG